MLSKWRTYFEILKATAQSDYNVATAKCVSWYLRFGRDLVTHSNAVWLHFLPWPDHSHFRLRRVQLAQEGFSLLQRIFLTRHWSQTFHGIYIQFPINSPVWGQWSYLGSLSHPFPWPFHQQIGRELEIGKKKERRPGSGLEDTTNRCRVDAAFIPNTVLYISNNLNRLTMPLRAPRREAIAMLTRFGDSSFFPIYSLWLEELLYQFVCPFGTNLAMQMQLADYVVICQPLAL